MARKSTSNSESSKSVKVKANASEAASAPDALTAALTSSAGQSRVGETSRDMGIDLASSNGSDATALVVIGPKRGRWRAGIFFSQEPVTIPIDQLTEKQADQIRDDVLLAVSMVRLDDTEA